jgi:hypothetical protein
MKIDENWALFFRLGNFFHKNLPHNNLLKNGDDTYLWM